MLIAVLTAAAAEEFMFRHFAVNFLLNRNTSVEKAGLVTCLLFALAHISNITDSDWLSITNQTAMAFTLGVLMYSLAIATRSVTPGIVFHFVMNIPINIDRLEASVDEPSSPITLLSALFSIVAIQVLYAPITATAILLFRKVRHTTLDNSFTPFGKADVTNSNAMVSPDKVEYS